ncbi:MAG TPA: hypothetical protein VH478_23205 [Trebonia sp.]|nr:hypothetical protein [Trebonia sp.]
MKLTMLCKDEGSAKNGCPSVYVTDAGDLVVQGPILDETATAQLESVLPGEGAVRISADVVARAVDLYRSRATGTGR